MYLVGVRPVLVLGSVRGVGESFVASLVLANVRFLTGVRAQMCFKILQAGVGLGAALELQRNREENKSHQITAVTLMCENHRPRVEKERILTPVVPGVCLCAFVCFTLCVCENRHVYTVFRGV